jgi:SAM-dependent methyltransferase
MMTVETSYRADEIESLYREDYFQGREYIDYLADKPAQQKTLARHLNVVRRYVPSGGRLLEIGCAYGYFLELIAQNYPNSIGLDVSEAAVAHARRQGLDARHGDLLETALPGSFDAVCLWDTLEHLPRPAETIRRAASLLKPGGYLFLSTGDFGSLLARVQGLRWRQIHPPTHLFYFTRPALRALVRRLGMDAVRFRTVRVYRRLGSALRSLDRFHADSLSGRCARGLLGLLPQGVLVYDVPLNLGDTLLLVARKIGVSP